VENCGVDAYGLGYGPVVGTGEHGNEPLDSIRWEGGIF
jgi:hypothetical protein